MTTLTINGTLYNVIKSETPDQVESKGYAALMRGQGIVARHIMRRGNGSNVYEVSEFKGKRYSKVVSLGKWS